MAQSEPQDTWTPDHSRKGKDFLTRKLLEGSFYSTGKFFESIASGNTKKIVLTNPSSSDVRIGTTFSISAEGKSKVDKKQNVTIDSSGDELTTLNKAHSHTNSNPVTAELGGDNETGTFSGGQAFNSKHLGAGKDQKTASPGDVGNGISNIIPPGENLSIEITNQLTESFEASIDVDYVLFPIYEANDT